MSSLIDVKIEDSDITHPTEQILQERNAAISDLLEENEFILPNTETQGPYRLLLANRDRRLIFDIKSEDGQAINQFQLSLGPFRQVVKDYFQICASYFDAVKNLPPIKIEAIDMARRGIHNEGARILQERLEGKVEIDKNTARRLFTLVCVLHWKVSS